MDTVSMNPVSAVDAVRNALEADIMSLRFAAGAKITESDLAARYGVSRNTVREAIAHLLSDGLLTKVANKGVSVRRFTVQDVQEIFHLRALLELEALRRIMSSNKKPDELYRYVEQLEQTNRQENWDAYVRTDILFHSNLVDFADSPRLSKLYHTILTEVKLCIYQTRNYVQIPEKANSTHRKILDAICEGEKRTAEYLLQEHIEHVIKRYCAGLLAMDQNE